VCITYSELSKEVEAIKRLSKTVKHALATEGLTSGVTKMLSRTGILGIVPQEADWACRLVGRTAGSTGPTRADLEAYLASTDAIVQKLEPLLQKKGAPTDDDLSHIDAAISGGTGDASALMRWLSLWRSA
jgi:hypothetical protein